MRIFWVGAFALVGCAARHTVVQGPNGKAYEVSCRKSPECYEEAARLCAPNGYNLLSTAEGKTTYVANGNTLTPISGRTRMLVDCKKP